MIRAGQTPLPPRDSDPVIEAYKKGVDRTLIRENLKLTPEQRIENLMALQIFAEELREAGRRRQAVQMTDFGGLLRRLVDAEVEFILVGGVAATAHGGLPWAERIRVFCPIQSNWSSTDFRTAAWASTR